ncbi:MAG: hypothetical protein ACI9Y7_001556 [Dokdonia sp.]|jgi:hypothetical protein
MKILNFYPILVCLLLLFSCATDDEIITENNITSNLELHSPEIQDEIPNNNRTPGTHYELALNMHWMSFITAESIMEYELARQDFSNITSNQDVIALEDVIGSNANGDFKDAFFLNLTEAIQGIVDNMHCSADPMSCGAPDPPATTPPLPTGIGPTGTPASDDQIPTAQEVIAYLMNYVLNQHCLEIFVPKTIPDTGEILEIAATQHPLSAIQSNEAAILTNQEDPISTHRYIYYDIISSSYINGIASQNKYVIITRPKRVRDVCAYSQYNRIDFTKFFN